MSRPNIVTTSASGLDSLLRTVSAGNAILVEGNPGSGKTVLAAQFLYEGAKNYRERGMYVSFFEDRDSFKRNAKLLGLDFADLERKRLIRIEHCVSMTGKGMRESIGDIIRAILAFKPQRLVFDSISSVLQVMGQDETRVFLQTVFGTFVRQRRITTLLIGEIPYGDGHTTDGATEFFADGIIRLGRAGEYFTRPGAHETGPASYLRSLAILKMRGMKLSDPNRFFTIERGFRLITRPVPIPRISEAKYWKPIRDGDSWFSSGSKDLDALLGGGYPKGEYAVLEADSTVPIAAIRLFQFPLAWNFLSQERAVLMLPTLGAASDEIKSLMTKHIAVETFEKRVRIFERVRSIKRLSMGQGPSYVISAKHDVPLEETEELLNQTCLDLMQETGKPVARLIGFPTLENIYAGREDLLFGFIGEAIAQNKLMGNFTLAVSRSELEITKPVLDLVDLHLRLIERNGYEFVRVVKPVPTEYFAVGCETGEGFPTLKLTAMV